MKVLLRTEFGNPILRREAKEIPHKFLKTAKFKKLVQRMIYTMRRVGGVGLAAPQVGIPLSISVMEVRPTTTHPTLKRKGPIIIVNPRIIKYSKKKVSDWGGCLSFKNVCGLVPRSDKIIVQYCNLDGVMVTDNASGLWARIFQHEIDHLNGNVYVDLITDMTSLMTLSEFKKRVLKKRR